VRAQTLQELVYKQGTAGITKATVSIVFHNDDPANGPSGYEDKEYITVTRQVRIGLTPAARRRIALPHEHARELLL
jgi:structural maintenance of chromosome 2